MQKIRFCLFKIVVALVVLQASFCTAEILYYAPFDSSPEMSISTGDVKIQGVTKAIYRKGKRGNALVMGDENSRHLSFSSEDPFIQRDGSIELWFMPSDWDASVTGTFRISMKTADNKTIICLKEANSSNIYFVEKTPETSTTFFTPAYHIKKDEWQQLLITRIEGKTSYYLNGEPAGIWHKKIHINKCDEIEQDTLQIVFQDETLLDELRIYSRGFTRSEAEDRYIMAHLGRLNYHSPTITIPYTHTPPDTSKGIDITTWSKAAVISDFIHMKTAKKAIQQTWVYLMYDDEKVYILYRSPVFEGGLVGGAREYDVLDGGDEIELFIMPEYTETFDFYQFIGNPWDSIFDSLRRDRKDWRGDWLYRNNVDTDWWDAEIWVNNYSMLGATSPVNGEVWTVNFCRNWRSGNEAKTDGGWTQWSQTAMGYHSHKDFGTLIFGGPETIIVQAETISSITEDATHAIFNLINTSSSNRDVVIRYEFYPAGDYLPYTVNTTVETLTAGTNKKYVVKCAMGSFTKGLVNLLITDDSNKTVYFRQMVNIETREGFEK